MNQKDFLKLSKKLIGMICSTRSMTEKKDGLYEFQKYRTLRVFGLTILNVTISIENAVNDHVYQKDAMNSFKESARPNLQEKVKKELTLKNTNKLLKRRH